MDVLDRAIEFIRQDHVHGLQTRKIGNTPFAEHPIAVAKLVLEHTGDRDLAAAAVLHDVLEDTDITADELRAEFGEQITSWVLECTEIGTDDSENKQPWKVRKESYLEHLATSSEGARWIALADKTNNAQDTLNDLRRMGDEMWDNFNAGKDEQMWWYSELKAEFEKTPSALQSEFSQIVDEILVLSIGIDEPSIDEPNAQKPSLEKPEYILRDMLRHNPDQLRKENPEMYEKLRAQSDAARPDLNEAQEIADGLNDTPASKLTKPPFDMRD